MLAVSRARRKGGVIEFRSVQEKLKIINRVSTLGNTRRTIMDASIVY